MQPGSGQLSNNKFVFLLGLLGFIWVLCYMAEQKLPERNIMEAYDRMPDRNITQQSQELAKKISFDNLDLKAQEAQYQLYSQKYNIPKQQAQKHMCVILSGTYHKQPADIRAFKSVVYQNYSNFNIFYFHGYKEAISSAQEFMKLKKVLFKHMTLIRKQVTSEAFASNFVEGQTYCKSDDIVVFLQDDNIILGNWVFKLINTLYTRNKQLKLAYSGALNSEQKLTRSYPYPQEIIENALYTNYPFVMGGLWTFRGTIYQNIDREHMTDKKTRQLFKHTQQAAAGSKLLFAASSYIHYIPQPLILQPDQTLFVTASEQIRAQIDQIYKSIDDNL